MPPLPLEPSAPRGNYHAPPRRVSKREALVAVKNPLHEPRPSSNVNLSLARVPCNLSECPLGFPIRTQVGGRAADCRTSSRSYGEVAVHCNVRAPCGVVDVHELHHRHVDLLFVTLRPFQSLLVELTFSDLSKRSVSDFAYGED